MATVTAIGSLVSGHSGVRGERPCGPRAGVSVRRNCPVVQHGVDSGRDRAPVWHLSLAQVHAALAYYHANQAEIESDLEAETRETDILEQQHQR